MFSFFYVQSVKLAEKSRLSAYLLEPYGGFCVKRRCCLFWMLPSAFERRDSPQCFTAVLTFKSSQGSSAGLFKNNQFSSLPLTLLTLDHYHCGTLRRLGVHNLYEAGAMRTQRERQRVEEREDPASTRSP